jgi:hypothetical protein
MQAEDYIKLIKVIKSNPRNFDTFTKSSEKDKCNSLKLLSEAQLFLKYHLSELESRAFELKNKVRAKCGVSSVSNEKLNEVHEQQAKRMKITFLEKENQSLQERLLLLKAKRDVRNDDRDIKPKNESAKVNYVLHPSLGMDQRSTALLSQLKALQKEKQALTKENRLKRNTLQMNESEKQTTLAHTTHLFPELSDRLQSLRDEVKRLTEEKEDLEREEKDLRREMDFGNQKIDFYRTTVALAPEDQTVKKEIEHLEKKVQSLEKQIRDTVGQTFSVIDNSANVESKRRRLSKLNEQLAEEKIRQNSLKEYLKIQDDKVTEAKKKLDRVLFENDTVDDQMKATEAMITSPGHL